MADEGGIPASTASVDDSETSHQPHLQIPPPIQPQSRKSTIEMYVSGAVTPAMSKRDSGLDFDGYFVRLPLRLPSVGSVLEDFVGQVHFLSHMTE
jgi:hypothetical protein